MKARVKKFFDEFSAVAVLVVSLATFAAAQTLPLPQASPTPLLNSPPVLQQDPANDGSPTVYGLQGVLIETLDNRIVAAQSVDQAFNPASAVKLATALVALRTFGPDHRFNTGFWSDGTFDRATGQLTGNLYVSGRDPSFHHEHAVMISRELNNLGIRTVTGNLIVSPDFTMNFSWSSKASGNLLYDTLDSSLRSTEAIRAWTYERTALADFANLQTMPSIAVMGEVAVGPVAPGAKLLLTHKSSKLRDILKVLLCYSNNFMAERIGENVGGRETVMRQLTSTLAIPAEELQLASLSGLGVNRVTPRAMMKIFRALRSELQKYKLTPSDIMPVAGIDPGTLEERFTGPAWRGSVIAKTGTLTRTDGGASSLVGQMRTRSGETLLFVIMNQRGSVLRFRSNQDYLVMQVQNSRGGPRAFDYNPLPLTMRLSDTESVSNLASEEMGPAQQAHPK
jgi:D-alanyl-D-alanine carboxypeptidase/D-alanyl-D-alanine-endopeptidase (penicillin-binding protein 4)